MPSGTILTWQRSQATGLQHSCTASTKWCSCQWSFKMYSASNTIKVPTWLHRYFHRCCQPFLIEHAKLYKKGSCVTCQHEAVKQEWTVMAELAYSKSCIGNQPNIFFFHNMRTSAGMTAAAIVYPCPHNHPGLKTNGNEFVNSFWVLPTTCIFDHASSNKKHPQSQTL